MTTFCVKSYSATSLLPNGLKSGILYSSFADFTNRRVQVAKMPFQSPGNLDFGQNSGRFSVPKGLNVKSAKLLIRLPLDPF
jgi:hypothetical protein